jgi:hypothetical protein
MLPRDPAAIIGLAVVVASLFLAGWIVLVVLPEVLAWASAAR